MAQRKSVRGPRSSVLWLVIVLVLVLAIALATVVFVIGPERQLAVQATATAQAHASEVQRAYDAGVAFATAGDWDKAAEQFAKVVALEPGYKDAVARLAEARANADAARATATAQAIAMAKKAAATATAEIRSAIESAYQRGLAYFDLERWEQAKAEFEQVIAVDPNYKDVQAKLAEAENRLAEIRALTPTATLTITPGPSPTPLPTATNTPTAALTNTPTPAPTSTPTSMPTNTSTPTPIPNTPPETVLSLGETWYQDGIAFTFIEWQERNIWFTVENYSGGELYFSFSKDTFGIYDDKQVRSEYTHSVIWRGEGTGRVSDKLDADEQLTFEVELDQYYPIRPGEWKYFIIKVDELSRVTNARWRVDIPH
jgi:tetratricopeptide (TPR) repeat protein